MRCVRMGFVSLFCFTRKFAFFTKKYEKVRKHENKRANARIYYNIGSNGYGKGVAIIPVFFYYRTNDLALV